MPEFEARSRDAKSSVPNGPDSARGSSDAQEPHAAVASAACKAISDANASPDVAPDGSDNNSASATAIAAAATDNNSETRESAASHDIEMQSLEQTSENTRDSFMSSEDREKEKAVAEAVALTAAAVAAITGAMKDEEKKKTKLTGLTNKSKNNSKKSDKNEESDKTKDSSTSTAENHSSSKQSSSTQIGQSPKANNTSNDLVDPEIQRKDSDAPTETSPTDTSPGAGEATKQMNKEDIIEFYQDDSDGISMIQSAGSSNNKLSANNTAPKKHTMKPPPQLKDLETSDNLKNWRDFMRFDDAKTKLINEPSKGKYIYVCALCNKEFFYNSRNGPRTIVSHLKKHKDHHINGKNSNAIMENIGNLNNGTFANGSFINSIQTNGGSIDILNNPEAAAMEVISKLTNQDIDTSKISISNEISANSNNNSSHFDQLDESKLDNIVKNASKKWRSHFIEISDNTNEENNNNNKNDLDKNSEIAGLKEQQNEVNSKQANTKNGEGVAKVDQDNVNESDKEAEKKIKANGTVTSNGKKSVTKYKCKYCDRQFTYCSRNGPTSLIRHLENLHKPQFLNPASQDIASKNDQSGAESSTVSFNDNTMIKKNDIKSVDTDKDDINCMLYIAKAARFWRLHYDKNEEKTDALILEKEKESAQGKVNDESVTSQLSDKKLDDSTDANDSEPSNDSKEATAQSSNDKSMVITKGPLKRKSRYSPEVYDCKFCGSSKVYLSRNGPKTLSRHLEKHHKKELLQIDEQLLSTVSYEIFKRSNENFV